MRYSRRAPTPASDAQRSPPHPTAPVGWGCRPCGWPIEQRRRGHARGLCSALLAWGAERGATRAYVQVLVDNRAGIALYESLGFTTQHRSRYLDAALLSGRRL